MQKELYDASAMHIEAIVFFIGIPDLFVPFWVMVGISKILITRYLPND